MWGIRNKVALFLVCGLPLLGRAEVPLRRISSQLFSCPLRDHNDPFNFDGAVESVAETLKQKIDGKDRCMIGLQRLMSEMRTVQNYYDNYGLEAVSTVEQEIYLRNIEDLSVRLSQMEANNQTRSRGLSAASIEALIAQLESAMINNRSQTKAIQFRKTQTQEDRFRLDLYTQTNRVLETMLDLGNSGECQDLMLHWRSLIPQVMGISSLATGVTGMQNQALFGSLLAVAANLTNLLINSKEKSALNKLTAVKNDEVLACTYFSVRNAACEYQRNSVLQEDRKAIERLLNLKIDSGKNRDFEEFFLASELADDLDQVFRRVSDAGSPLTLDTSLLSGYLVAKKSNPEFLPSPPPPTADSVTKQTWLLEVSIAGISFPTIEPLTGAPVPLDDQIGHANTAIENAKAKILTTESIIAEKQSFEDLRHSLDRSHAGLVDQLDLSLTFLRQYLDGGSSPIRGIRIRPNEEGSMFSAIDLLDKLRSFLVVTPESATAGCDLPEQDPKKRRFKCYLKKLNKLGLEFFVAMARGAVAQINEQSVLTIGPKASIRYLTALKIIENNFIRKDMALKDYAFLEFKRHKSAWFAILNKLESFDPLSVGFRAEKIVTARESFEKGFGDEIHRMVKRALDIKSEEAPSLDGATAPALCALFSTHLNRSRAGRVLLKRCRSEAPQLRQISEVSSAGIAIDFENPCFYSEYVRLIESQRMLVRRRQEDRREPGAGLRK